MYDYNHVLGDIAKGLEHIADSIDKFTLELSNRNQLDHVDFEDIAGGLEQVARAIENHEGTP